MRKKSFIYSDLSQKELQILKEFYIQKKIDSMSNKELRDFVLEVISHQITDTIDKEEEMEAWREMSNFFGEEFEPIITDIVQKYEDGEIPKINEKNDQEKRKYLLDRNNYEKEKKDMWDD